MNKDDLFKTLESLAQAIQTAQIQIRLHRNILDHWSFGKLATQYQCGEQDLGLALDSFVQYALKMERQIDLSPSLRLNVGQTVEEVIVSDRALASHIVKLSQSSLFIRSPMGDVELSALGSFAALPTWLSFLDKQLELVRQMGLPSYLSIIAEASYRPRDGLNGFFGRKCDASL